MVWGARNVAADINGAFSNERMPAARPDGLSHDLWAKIFVEVGDGDIGSVGLDTEDPSSKAKAQTKFFQLRLVCHKFNDVFKRHSRLFRGLVLPPELTEMSLLS
ncbi:hypothetical protein ABBQ38_015033 [Trebouxia sp. C0009 RCD-2024]